MIAKKIYEGATAKDLKITEMQYDSRKKILDEFLLKWDGQFFEDSFLKFIEKYRCKDTVIQSEPQKREKYSLSVEEDEESTDITYGEMFKGLAKNIKAIVESGFEVCSNSIHEARYKKCKQCEYFVCGRCTRCGCFMKLKTKFKSMNCPMGYW